MAQEPQNPLNENTVEGTDLAGIPEELSVNDGEITPEAPLESVEEEVPVVQEPEPPTQEPEKETLVGQGQEVLDDATQEELEQFEEDKKEVPSMSPMPDRLKTLEGFAQEAMEVAGVESVRREDKFSWQKSIQPQDGKTPNEYLERLFNNKEYRERIEKIADIEKSIIETGEEAVQVESLIGGDPELTKQELKEVLDKDPELGKLRVEGYLDAVATFDKLGRAQDVAGLLKQIVHRNKEKATINGVDFDVEEHYIKLAGKLYNDLRFKLQGAENELDINDPEFKEFLGTYEAIDEIQNGLALYRDYTRGKFKMGFGESYEDVLRRINQRGVFDGSGKPSQWRLGVSKEDWEGKSALNKTVSWIPNTAVYTAERVKKMLPPSLAGALGVENYKYERKFTTPSGELVGAMTPYIGAIGGSLALGQAGNVGRLGIFAMTELTGILADFAFTIEGEGNLSNILEQHGLLPEAMGWLAVTEDDPYESEKNAVEGLGISPFAALVGTFVKHGFKGIGKVGKKLQKEFGVDALTDNMMDYLHNLSVKMQKESGQKGKGIFENRGKRLAYLYSGLPLDAKQLWHSIIVLRDLAPHSKEHKEALEKSQKAFDEKTQGLSPEEIQRIKTDEYDKSLKESGMDVDGENLWDRKWNELSGKERYEAVEYSSVEFKEARSWNDVQKAVSDRKTALEKGVDLKGVPLTDTSREVLESEIQGFSIAMKKRLNEFATKHDVNLKEWDQGKETLREFLQRKNIPILKTDDEIADIKETLRGKAEAQARFDKIWENIEDPQVRDTIRDKVTKGEKLTPDEEELLQDSVGLATESHVKELEDKIFDLERGRISLEDEALLRNARNFKKWLTNLPEGELKDGIREALESGRKLTDVEVKALKDGGVEKIYNTLRKKGFLNVDTKGVDDLIEQGKKIEDEISSYEQQLRATAEESYNAKKAAVEKAAKKLDQLSTKLDEARLKELTPEQQAAKQEAEKGLTIAKEDLAKIRKEYSETPEGALSFLERKLRLAENLVKKKELELEEFKRPFTPEEEALLSSKKAELESLREQSATLNRAIKDTDRGQFNKLLKDVLRAEDKLRVLDEKYGSYNRPLTDEEIQSKQALERELKDLQARAKGVVTLLKGTSRGRLRTLLQSKNRVQKNLDKKYEQLRKEQNTVLTKQEQAEQAELQQEISRLYEEIDDVKYKIRIVAGDSAEELFGKREGLLLKLDELDDKLAKGETLNKKEEALRKSLNKEIDGLDKDIKKLKKSLSKTEKAKLDRLQKQVEKKRKRKAEMEGELFLYDKSRPNVLEEEIAEARERVLQLNDEISSLGKEQKGSAGFALGKAMEQLKRAEDLSKSYDEATGKTDPVRFAYAQLGRALRAYRVLEDGTQEKETAGHYLERAFVLMQKARVDRYEETGEQLLQSHRLTKSAPNPVSESDQNADTILKDWSRRNSNNGNFTAKDIDEAMYDFDDTFSTSWSSKEAGQKLDEFFENHDGFSPKYQGIKGVSLMKQGVTSPVAWLQGARLLRTASYVSGIGTSALALTFGILASGNRYLSRKVAGAILARQQDVKLYLEQQKRLANKGQGVNLSTPDNRRENIFQLLFTPSRDSLDSTGATARELSGAGAGFEGRELEHLGRMMDASSLTMLGARAQSIENDALRTLMTSAVSLLEFMPRRFMGKIDDIIKGFTYDESLRRSVATVLHRRGRRFAEDDDLALEIVNALRALEESMIAGKTQPNEIRQFLGAKLGSPFSENVELAMTARNNAWEMQRELTLQQEVWGVAKALHNASQHPLGGHFFMFGKTQGNTINMTLERTPLIGMLMPTMKLRNATPQQKLDTVAKQITGMTMLGLGATAKELMGDKIRQDKYGGYEIILPIKNKSIIAKQVKKGILSVQGGYSKAVDHHNALAEFNRSIHKNRSQDRKVIEAYAKNNNISFNQALEEMFPTFDKSRGVDEFVDAYIGENASGFVTLSAKRFGHTWGLFTSGMALHEVVFNNTRHIPKQHLEEIGFADKFNKVAGTAVNLYGVGEIHSTIEDIASIFGMSWKEASDSASHIASVILTDMMTPLKGLLQSPSEPIGWATRQVKGFITGEEQVDPNYDYRYADFFEKFLTKAWWGLDAEFLGVKSDPVFQPIPKPEREVTLIDSKYSATTYQVKAVELDLDVPPLTPTSWVDLGNQINLLDFVDEATGKNAYTRLIELSREAVMDSRDIKAWMNQNVWEGMIDEQQNLKSALEYRANYGITDSLSDWWNDKEFDVDKINVGVEAKKLIEAKIKEGRNLYAQKALRNFYRTETITKDSETGEEKEVVVEEFLKYKNKFGETLKGLKEEIKRKQFKIKQKARRSQDETMQLIAPITADEPLIPEPEE